MGSSSGKLTLEVVIEGIRGAVRSVSIIGGSVQAVGPGFLPRLEGPLPRDVPRRVARPWEWPPPRHGPPGRTVRRRLPPARPPAAGPVPAPGRARLPRLPGDQPRGAAGGRGPGGGRGGPL